LQHVLIPLVFLWNHDLERLVPEADIEVKSVKWFASDPKLSFIQISWRWGIKAKRVMLQATSIFQIFDDRNWLPQK